jgi:hypothetical protein
MTDNEFERTEKGSQYIYEDGTVEVVFAVEGARVLTVREYPTRRLFESAISEAADADIHEEVADLPDVSEFIEEPVDEDRESERGDGPDRNSDGESGGHAT